MTVEQNDEMKVSKTLSKGVLNLQSISATQGTKRFWFTREPLPNLTLEPINLGKTGCINYGLPMHSRHVSSDD